MKEALVALSRKGKFKEKVDAANIRSREHARKLWPLVSPEPPFELVTYVSPSFDPQTRELLRRSYFSRLPKGKRKSIAKRFSDEEREWLKETSESAIHRVAKDLIAESLRQKIEAGEELQWSFSDKDRSDFPLKGNLLLGAIEVRTEYPLPTPFGKNYRLDVAVLGKSITAKPIVLAGIEIELSHSFDGYKGLIGKTIGFPLISVDVSDLRMEDITPEWAAHVLHATTLDSEMGLRKTYIYLHDLVCPQFAQIPKRVSGDPKHQYLIFAKDNQLDQLEQRLKKLATALGYGQYEVAIAKINAVSKQAKDQLETAGDVVGPDWKTVNDSQCLRVAIAKPIDTNDLRAHLYHSTMARLLLTESDTLVGYKYCNGINNNDLEEDIWVNQVWLGRDKELLKHRILPKRLAEPISTILGLVNELKNG